jgi:hypothetical protein
VPNQTEEEPVKRTLETTLAFTGGEEGAEYTIEVEVTDRNEVHVSVASQTEDVKSIDLYVTGIDAAILGEQLTVAAEEAVSRGQ